MSQIALPFFAHGTSATRIVAGEANRQALEALARPESWPFRTAVLVAPERAGKTVLARWFARDQRHQSLDDADRQPEAEVFHAWNRAQESNTPLLLTARPGWQAELPDLASRLAGSLHLAIGMPDEAMMADLLIAYAEQRRMVLGEGAAAYLVPRLERSFAAVEAVMQAIDTISLERQVPATMSVWRDALEAVQGPEQGRLL